MTLGEEFELLVGIEEMRDYAPELVPSFEAMYDLVKFLRPPDMDALFKIVVPADVEGHVLHLLEKDRFVNHDVLEGVCGHKGPGEYIGIPARVTCPKCKEKINAEARRAERDADRDRRKQAALPPLQEGHRGDNEG